MFSVIFNEDMNHFYHAEDYVDALNYASEHAKEVESIDIYKDDEYWESLK